MPRPKKEVVEDVEENGSGPYRLSITIDQTHRRHLRIAAALADMSVGEWAAEMIERAAEKALADQGVE